jgi:hypothetical protein
MGEKRNTSMVIVRNLNEKDHAEELGVHKTILKWILKKQDGEAWTGFGWLKIRTNGEMSGTTNPATQRRIPDDLKRRLVMNRGFP